MKSKRSQNSARVFARALQLVFLLLLGLVPLVLAGCVGFVSGANTNSSLVAPVITTQPTNQTVTVGQTATFSVAATGTAPITCQWQKNGSNITSATSAIYATPATTTSDSGSTFVVVVSNSAGSVTSNSATLTVNPAPVAPTITTQPANQTVTAGQTATFSVTATGTAPLIISGKRTAPTSLARLRRPIRHRPRPLQTAAPLSESW